MREMEPVLNDWKEQWDRICSSLYHQRSIKEYQAFCQQFERASADLEQEWENLAIYFVNTYMLGAVYDEDVQEGQQIQAALGEPAPGRGSRYEMIRYKLTFTEEWIPEENLDK